MIKTRLRGFSKSSGARKGIKAGKKPTSYLRMSILTRPLYFSMYFALAFYLILHMSISIHQAGSELPPFICLQMEPRLRCVCWSGPGKLWACVEEFAIGRGIWNVRNLIAWFEVPLLLNRVVTSLYLPKRPIGIFNCSSPISTDHAVSRTQIQMIVLRMAIPHFFSLSRPSPPGHCT